MRVSTASAVGVWGLCVLLHPGCASLDERDAVVEVQVAPLVEGGCDEGPQSGLPGEIDAVVIERADGDGWQRVDRVPAGGGELVLTRVEAGDAALRLVACAGQTPRLVAEPGPIRVDEAGKSALTVSFKPTGRLACAGTGLGPDYDRFAGPARPRAFAVAAPIGPGRVLVAGGADTVQGARLSVRDAAAGWEVYDAAEALFLPGVDRATPLDPRPLGAARVAAEAVVWRAPGASRDGVLVLGGAPAVSQGRFPFGPLAPPDGVTAGAVYFDPDRGSFGPVKFDGVALATRFMAGTGVDEAGRVVRVGGINEANDPSDRVELIAGGALSTIQLPVDPERQAQVEAGVFDVRLARNVLVGASVTPIGEGRFLVWGGDYNGCGAQPGWLVSTTPALAVEALTIEGPEPAPTCGDPVVCRSWYSTGYHAAARLAPGAGGEARVLITGGLPLGSRNVVGSPDPGAMCAPNAFVVGVDPAAKTARIEPVGVAEPVAGALKRALHRAVVFDGAVMLVGGWVAGADPAGFEGTAEVVRYDDAGGVFEVIGDQLGAARLGGFAAAVPGGGAVFGGGVRGGAVLDSAEIYTPTLPGAVCAE